MIFLTKLEAAIDDGVELLCGIGRVSQENFLQGARVLGHFESQHEICLGGEGVQLGVDDAHAGVDGGGLGGEVGGERGQGGVGGGEGVDYGGGLEGVRRVGEGVHGFVLGVEVGEVVVEFGRAVEEGVDEAAEPPAAEVDEGFVEDFGHVRVDARDGGFDAVGGEEGLVELGEGETLGDGVEELGEGVFAVFFGHDGFEEEEEDAEGHGVFGGLREEDHDDAGGFVGECGEGVDELADGFGPGLAICLFLHLGLDGEQL